jgi:hypothetical protein
MTCRYCREAAGWWRRRCEACSQLAELFEKHRGADFGTFMDMFVATGLPAAKIERFLAADPDGDGTIRDHIAADMTNELMRALGNDTRQSAADVKRIRERGNWVNLDRRPTE